MDIGWIILPFAADSAAAPQISVATKGGSGTPVPNLTIEMDDLDEVERRALEAGFSIEYGPVNESCGITRFHVRYPFGRLISILTHDRRTDAPPTTVLGTV